MAIQVPCFVKLSHTLRAWPRLVLCLGEDIFGTEVRQKPGAVKVAAHLFHAGSPDRLVRGCDSSALYDGRRCFKKR